MGVAGAAIPISATKLPVAGFRRQLAGCYNCFDVQAKYGSQLHRQCSLAALPAPSGEAAERHFVKSARARPTGGLPPPALAGGE